MLALLLDDYKPDFILRRLFLQSLWINVRSHVPQEKVSEPRTLTLRVDELYQNRISSSVNLLSKVLEDSLQVNAVTSFSCP